MRLAFHSLGTHARCIKASAAPQLTLVVLAGLQAAYVARAGRQDRLSGCTYRRRLPCCFLVIGKTGQTTTARRCATWQPTIKVRPRASRPAFPSVCPELRIFNRGDFLATLMPSGCLGQLGSSNLIFESKMDGAAFYFKNGLNSLFAQNLCNCRCWLHDGPDDPARRLFVSM